MRRRTLLFALICLTNLPAVAQDSLYVRIIDVGQGHAAVASMPGGGYMVYDTGHYLGEGATAFEGISDVVPADEPLDLLILSHSDSDHLGGVERITNSYVVTRIIHGGLERIDLSTWRRADQAIRDEAARGARVIDLKSDELPPGATYRIGDAFVTVVSGFYAPPDTWNIRGGPEGGEFRNAGSIVVRVLYAGRSILFTGDAVGRHKDDGPDALIATEKYMIENSPAVPIDSDVLIAPHHGADNASSTAFISAVSPGWVVFPAGRRYEHPDEDTALRYLAAGVDTSRIFRTDLGDDEGGEEWDFGRVNGARDTKGDDDVEIVVHQDGTIGVRYRTSE